MLANLSENKPLLKGLTFLLVLGTIPLAFFDIEAMLNIVTYIMALFSRDTRTASALVTPLMLVLGLGALAFIIITMEYHLRHAGERRSFRLLGISLGVQAALFIIGYLWLGSLA